MRTVRDMSTHEQDQQTRRPVILVVDSDVAGLKRTAQTLTRRFGADYAILSASAAPEGLQALSDLATDEAEVALVAAALKMTGGDGPALLDQIHSLHPGAGRALLIEMGDSTATESVRHAASRSQIDFCIVGGWESPEEWLYPRARSVDEVGKRPPAAA